ncbi:MAG TPA: hypothetical protein VMK05_11680 [Burkholderiales bacterium]|nr:hypothetical protein [Burkholderiales bacterium]
MQRQQQADALRLRMQQDQARAQQPTADPRRQLQMQQLDQQQQMQQQQLNQQQLREDLQLRQRLDAQSAPDRNARIQMERQRFGQERQGQLSRFGVEREDDRRNAGRDAPVPQRPTRFGDVEVPAR